MSEKWKYQLRMGIIWGLFMSVFNLLFNLQSQSLVQQLQSSGFYVRAVLFIVVGVFVLGNYNWNKKNKPRN